MTELDVAEIPFRSHAEVMTEYVDLAGKRVLDVGCGAGRLVRTMTALDAVVTGIEPGARQLAKALAADPAGAEKYLQGTAEELPVADRSIDVIVFFNSLHHVPVDGMRQALLESRRVLRDDGALYIAEPLAQGSQFELNRPFNDETAVRAAAYRVIQDSATLGFQEEHETIYATDVSFADFEAFRENSTSINPAREAYFEAHDEELRRRFESCAQHRADGWHLCQYIRVNVLRPIQKGV